MDYITRSAETEFLAISQTSKVVLVTGAGEIGKAAMMKHLSMGTRRIYISMEDLHPKFLAETDPDLFFTIFTPPIIIDGIHHAPGLLKKIKEICDAGCANGEFWLTCTPKASFVEYVKAFLDQHLSFMHMYGLSTRERLALTCEEPLEFAYDTLTEREANGTQVSLRETFEHIYRGAMPQMQHIAIEEKEEHFYRYFHESLIPEVDLYKKIRRKTEFCAFLSACAANISKVLSIHKMAKASGISTPAAKKWLNLLIDMGVIYLLEPYGTDEFYRPIAAPKLYFTDTGFCAYLAQWKSSQELMNGAEGGAYFENHMVMEVIKNLANRKGIEIKFYRDGHMKEINLLIIKEREICPLQIRKNAAPLRTEILPFSLFDGKSVARGCGGILCTCEEVRQIDDRNCYIPHHIL